MSLIEQPKIWLPTRGMVDRRALAVERAIQEYDERLVFGRHEETRDWCAFMKFPPGDPVFPELYPVVGFGQEIPEPREAVERLIRADSLRQAESQLDRVNRRNRERSERLAEPVKAAEEEFALAAESYLRNIGETKWSKSYGVKSKRGRA